MTTTRRQFLRRGWELGGAVLAAAAAWTTWEALRPLSAGGASGVVKLGSPSSFPPDSAKYVSEGHLYVTNAKGNNAQGQLFALSQKCPHLGCKVPFCESSGRFECPCHGSKFDLAGEWIQGPAPRGMDQYGLAVVNDTLVADTNKVIPGPNRGAKKYYTDPKGPSCS